MQICSSYGGSRHCLFCGRALFFWEMHLMKIYGGLHDGFVQVFFVPIVILDVSAINTFLCDTKRDESTYLGSHIRLSTLVNVFPSIILDRWCCFRFQEIHCPSSVDLRGTFPPSNSFRVEKLAGPQHQATDQFLAPLLPLASQSMRRFGLPTVLCVPLVVPTIAWSALIPEVPEKLRRPRISDSLV